MADSKKFDCDKVTITQDNGEELTYDVIAVFPAKIDNKTTRMYAAVLYEDASEDDDYLLYRCDNSDIDDIKLSEIETDEEFEIVCDAFEELQDEEEYREMVGDLFDEE